MHHNLLLAWLAIFSASFKKAANQANNKLWCINYGSYVLKIVYLLNLLCMLEFYTALLVYLFFLASAQWFHNFKSFSNLHLVSPSESHLFWDSTTNLSSTDTPYPINSKCTSPQYTWDIPSSHLLSIPRYTYNGLSVPWILSTYIRWSCHTYPWCQSTIPSS